MISGSRFPAFLALALLAPAVQGADGAEPLAWRRTLERISPSVVSIQVDATRAFDTEWNDSSQATGFVVDAERGLILTNRHVVTAGPVRAAGLFTNQEEVELIPVYRDPVHDFGFYRYDPRALKYIQPRSLPLYPAGAELGREIRVVGNDDGEQLSILAGTLARLRREAPDYGRGKYNDFNTFYLQAASSTSGGSSGSPVIDIDGRVIALNAGASNQAASSFFLPLDRVQRALALLQAGQPVTRGTLGATFRYTAFDELTRLGLREPSERTVRARFPDAIGMLVVSEVLTGSTGDGKLQVGDILVRLNGDYLTEFVPLAAVLDARVGEAVELTVERGGRELSFTLPVQDLDQLSPDEYLQFGDAVVNNLSYQQARHFNRAADGVYVANPGFVFAAAGIPRGSVIVGVEGEPVRRLDDLERLLAGKADQQRFTVRFVTLEEPASSKVRVARMDRRWFPAVRCRRDDRSGEWPCRTLAPGPEPSAPEGGVASFVEQPDARLRRITPSLVLVNFDMPYTVSGVSEQHYYGTGVVVDAARGLVAVDRNTIPEAVGDVQVTFGGSLEIPGRVAYVHPLHNLALVAYDPALIGDTPVTAARFAASAPEPGDDLWVVGLRNGEKLVSQSAVFASFEPVAYPLSRTIRFRESNLETLNLVSGPRDLDGVIVNRKGEVAALWSSFAWQGTGDLRQENRGMPVEYVREMVELVATGRELRSLEVEWAQMPIATARRLGLSADWAHRIGDHDPERRRLLSVLRPVAGTPAAGAFQPGDLLLTIDGQPATRFREVEKRVQKPAVVVEVLRDGEVLQLDVATVALNGDGVRRMLMWAGALLQAPYRDMAAQRGVEPTGVYVSYFAFGSPASRFGLYAGRRITQVDGIAIADLDQFIGIVRTKQNREAVRLTTVTWNNQQEVLTLKLDDTYWPAWQIQWQDGEWRRTDLP
ncbi:MAG: trypsin-like peptidase domain-containing protein [Gammaproteobacteria bacterium]|nr:trypsin-like peptidase domain-containing protein [Gammaproteobacteria bacterium]